MTRKTLHPNETELPKLFQILSEITIRAQVIEGELERIEDLIDSIPGKGIPHLLPAAQALLNCKHSAIQLKMFSESLDGDSFVALELMLPNGRNSEDLDEYLEKLKSELEPKGW